MPQPYHTQLTALCQEASLRLKNFRLSHHDCRDDALAIELAKMTKSEKRALAHRLLAETGAHDKPSALHGSYDPALDAELRCRLNDCSPGAWLSLDEFRAQTRPR